jgi:hypothetical protein
MADTFSNDLRLRLQESGANSGQWGSLLNDTLTNIASAFSLGSEAIPNASTHTITLADDSSSQDEARSLYLKCTGGGQACTVTLAPNTVSKVWIISNETSFTLTFSAGSGANVAVSAGAVKVIVTDGAGSGAAVVDALSGLSANVSDLTTTGNISFGDNDKAIFGAGSDLQIYHDGTHSNIKESGAGDLQIFGDNVNIYNAAGSQNLINLTSGGANTLFHNGSAKLATTSTGIDVTGTVTTDGLDIEIDDNAASPVTMQQGGNSYFKIVTTNSSESVQLGNSTTNPDILLGGGNVGIGIAPSKKLTVFGTGVGNATVQIEGEGGADPYINFLANNAQHWSLGIDDSDSDKFKLSEHSALGTNDYFVVDVTGNVGIGTQTPQAAKFSGSAVGILELANTKPVINIHETDVTDAELFMGMSGGSAVIGTTGNGKLIFQTGTSSASISAIIDASGNLLVGGTDTDPGSTGNSANAGTAIGASGYVSVARTGGSAIRAGRIDSDGAIIELFGDGASVGSIGVTGGDILFLTCESHGIKINSDAARIDPSDGSGNSSDGVLDLGDSGARFKDLYLSGGATHGTTPSSSAAGAFTEAVGRTTYSRGSGTGGFAHLSFINGNGAVGSVVTSGSATAYNTSSDYRLKENVVAMTGATERLKQLKPSRFNFIADAHTTVDGFLAHEVQDIVPEAIAGEKDAMIDEEYEVTPAVLDDDGNVITEAVMGTRSVPDYQGIDQSKLVPLLVATIQELEARITALENN